MQIVTHRNFLAGIVQKGKHHHCRDNAGTERGNRRTGNSKMEAPDKHRISGDI